MRKTTVSRGEETKEGRKREENKEGKEQKRIWKESTKDCGSHLTKMLPHLNGNGQFHLNSEITTMNNAYQSISASLQNLKKKALLST